MNAHPLLLQSDCNFYHKVTRGSSFFSEAIGAATAAPVVLGTACATMPKYRPKAIYGGVAHCQAK